MQDVVCLFGHMVMLFTLFYESDGFKRTNVFAIVHLAH